MEDKNRKSKSVCVPFDENTYKVLKAKAGNTQSVASVIRIAVMQYLGESAEKTSVVNNSTISMVPTITAMNSQAPIPEKKTAGDKFGTSPLIISNYGVEKDSVRVMYGPPVACPVCLKEYSELGSSALQIVNSGPGKGAWACYECFSSGRWSDTAEIQILKNTQSDQANEENSASTVKE